MSFVFRCWLLQRSMVWQPTGVAQDMCGSSFLYNQVVAACHPIWAGVWPKLADSCQQCFCTPCNPTLLHTHPMQLQCVIRKGSVSKGTPSGTCYLQK